MTTQELIEYYSSLLIYQYLGKPKAVATIQALAQATVMAQASLSDPILPLAVQDAFNLIGDSPATGVQLDVIGKYAGVTRTGTGFNGQIIELDDSDFLVFIKMAVITNSSGSSLSEIANQVYDFFGLSVIPFDYADMRMSYLISSSVGSTNLIELFVTEGLLAKPMGVQLSVILAPIIDAFFGFITYSYPVQPTITRPFNSYTSYQTNWPWVSYQDSFVA